MKILFSMVNLELSCANKEENIINKLFIPLLFLQVSTSEMPYFTEFIFGNCCIPTQVMEFCDKGFLYLLFFNCMLSSWETSWKKNEHNIFFYQGEKGYGKVNIFQCLFLQSGKPEFLWSLLLRMKKTGNFVELIFAIQCFFGIRFCNFGNLRK